MNRYKTKKAFTLVEIIIVLVVIAVLSAVAIPTFSSIYENINKKADVELATEMTSALESYENLYGGLNGIKAAMQALSLSGYENWNCKGENNTLYWYAEENIMVLINTEESDEKDQDNNPIVVNTVLYPEDENGVYLTAFSESSTRLNFFIYDQENLESEAMDFVITEKTADSENYSQITLKNYLTGLSDDEATALNDLIVTTNNNQTPNTAVYSHTYGLPLSNDTSSYLATARSMYIGGWSGDSVSPQYIYISIPNYNDNLTDAQKATAEKYAARLLCAILHQINKGTIGSDVKIIIQAGLTLDCDGVEWAQIKDKVFTGYIGSLLEDNPVTIKNLSLTSATSYKELTSFTTGSSSSDYYYSFAGFISCIGEDATLANLRFENLNIDEPGQDCDIQRSDKGPSNLRNCVGLVGAAVSGNPVLSNITVSGKISGTSVVGGLVGYIGNMSEPDASEPDTDPVVTLTIKDCSVSADLASSDYLSDSYCGSVGGFVGLMDNYNTTRTPKLIIQNDKYYDYTSKKAITPSGDCKLPDNAFSGSISGFRRMGGVIGNIMAGSVEFDAYLDASKSSLNTKHSATSVAGIACTNNHEALTFTVNASKIEEIDSANVAQPAVVGEQITKETKTTTTVDNETVTTTVTTKEEKYPSVLEITADSGSITITNYYLTTTAEESDNTLTITKTSLTTTKPESYQ